MASTETPLLVVGAALSRTGTLSTLLALEKLGYKVWHGRLLPYEPWPRLLGAFGLAEVAGNQTERKIALDNIVKQLSDDGFTATLDLPMALLYSDLMERYPKAKVLLTVRDNREAWAKSFVRNVSSLPPVLRRVPICLLPFARHLSGMRDWLFPIGLGVDMSDIHRPYGISRKDAKYKEEIGSTLSVSTVMDMYARFIAQVKQKVPPERLVVYNVVQGWQPLCDFIGFQDPHVQMTCPSETGEPFPYVNKSARSIVRPWFIGMYTLVYMFHFMVITGLCFMIVQLVRMCRLFLRWYRHLKPRSRRRDRQHQD